MEAKAVVSVGSDATREHEGERAGEQMGGCAQSGAGAMLGALVQSGVSVCFANLARRSWILCGLRSPP